MVLLGGIGESYLKHPMLLTISWPLAQPAFIYAQQCINRCCRHAKKIVNHHPKGEIISRLKVHSQLLQNCCKRLYFVNYEVWAGCLKLGHITLVCIADIPNAINAVETNSSNWKSFSVILFIRGGARWWPWLRHPVTGHYVLSCPLPPSDSIFFRFLPHPLE